MDTARPADRRAHAGSMQSRTRQGAVRGNPHIRAALQGLRGRPLRGCGTSRCSKFPTGPHSVECADAVT